MSKHYTVFLGRFSPIHRGHLHIIKKALEKSDHLIIGIGSSGQPRDIRNPWKSNERADMISLACMSEKIDLNRISFIHLNDYSYNDEKWMTQVETAVFHAINKLGFNPDSYKISLIGHKKDHTSYYLNMFVHWDSIPVENFQGLNSTDIREAIFNCQNVPIDVTPNSVSEYIQNLMKNNQLEWQRLFREYRLIKDYKKSWEAAPYPPTFVTADAVVTCGNHVLMVKRKAAPGEGLWAIPGGFVGQYERIKDAAVRELKEETQIDIPEKVLYGSIIDSQVFDGPYRSLRGRTITHAYRFSLGATPKTRLPKVKGSDDAVKAMWVPYSELNPEMIFEDHYSILQAMIKM